MPIVSKSWEDVIDESFKKWPSKPKKEAFMSKNTSKTEEEKKGFPILICAVYHPDGADNEMGLIIFPSKQLACEYIAEVKEETNTVIELVGTYNLAGLKRMYTKVIEEDVE